MEKLKLIEKQISDYLTKRSNFIKIKRLFIDEFYDLHIELYLDGVIYTHVLQLSNPYYIELSTFINDIISIEKSIKNNESDEQVKAEKTRLFLKDCAKRRVIFKDGIINTVLINEIEELERLATLGKKYEGGHK